VNEKDPHGKNLYGGGFLGMDNVSCLERSNPPYGLELLQVGHAVLSSDLRAVAIVGYLFREG